MGEPESLPELLEGESMHHELVNIGPLRLSGETQVPTDIDIINHYSSATDRISGPWELMTMFLMCKSYHKGLTSGNKIGAVAPALREVLVSDDKRALIAEAMRQRMAAIRERN